jgi:hypothetical protein
MAPGELSATLTLLELMGLIKRLPGEFYARQISHHTNTRADEKHPNASALVDGSIKFIRETFHGISRRYLQLYLAAYWCWGDRKRWTLGALLQHCLEVGEISSFEILSYVSPQMVQLFDMPIAQKN